MQGLRTLLLVALCALGTVHAARLDYDGSRIAAPVVVKDVTHSALQEDDAWALTFGAAGGDDDDKEGPHMRAFCNQDEICPAEIFNGSEPFSCWGTFKVFGKYVNETRDIHAMWGAKCEGNMRAFKAPGKATIAVCSGLMKQFGAHSLPHHSPPGGGGDDHGPPRRAAVHGRGCNGKHVFGMVRRKDEDGREVSELMSPVELHTALAASDAGVVRDARIEQALQQASATAGPHGPGRVEDSCDGKGGFFAGVLDVPRCHRARAAMMAVDDVDALEGVVNMSMRAMGVSLIPGTQPAPPPRPPRGEHSWHHHPHHAEPPHAPTPPPRPVADHPHCEVTCNGHTPWFKGLLPCWGKFEVRCARDEEAPEGDDDEEDWGWRPPRLFEASCEGFYSGFIGKACKGFAAKHVAGSGKDMRAYCSGMETNIIVRPGWFNHHHAAGFAAFCDGSALSTVAFHGKRGPDA